MWCYVIGKLVFVEGGSAFGAVVAMWGCSCVGVRSRDDWLEEYLWDARVHCPASQRCWKEVPTCWPQRCASYHFSFVRVVPYFHSIDLWGLFSNTSSLCLLWSSSEWVFFVCLLLLFVCWFQPDAVSGGPVASQEEGLFVWGYYVLLVPASAPIRYSYLPPQSTCTLG